MCFCSNLLPILFNAAGAALITRLDLSVGIYHFLTEVTATNRPNTVKCLNTMYDIVIKFKSFTMSSCLKEAKPKAFECI